MIGVRNAEKLVVLFGSQCDRLKPQCTACIKANVPCIVETKWVDKGLST